MTQIISFALGCILGGIATSLFSNKSKTKTKILEDRLNDAERDKERLRNSLTEADERLRKMSGTLERTKRNAREEENDKDDLEDSVFKLQQENKKLYQENELLSRDLDDYKSLIKQLRNQQ